MSTITTDDVVNLVNARIDELNGTATATATFDNLDIDSLACVEMAVLLGNHYGVALEEHEVAEAGNFTALTELLASKLQHEHAG